MLSGGSASDSLSNQHFLGPGGLNKGGRPGFGGISALCCTVMLLYGWILLLDGYTSCSLIVDPDSSFVLRDSSLPVPTCEF